MDASPACGCDAPDSISMDFTQVFLPQSSYMLHTFHRSQQCMPPIPSSLNSRTWKCIDRLVGRKFELRLMRSTNVLVNCCFRPSSLPIVLHWSPEKVSKNPRLPIVYKWLSIYSIFNLCHCSRCRHLHLQQPHCLSPPTRDVGMVFHCRRIL